VEGLGRRRADGPIRLGEFDAPEVRGRREEFDADARALFAGVTHIDDAAFLVFFGDRIGEDELGAQFERSMKIEQAAVGVDDDGFGALAEIAALGIFAPRAHEDAREDA
jgi:hypothetical protein